VTTTGGGDNSTTKAATVVTATFEVSGNGIVISGVLEADYTPGQQPQTVTGLGQAAAAPPAGTLKNRVIRGVWMEHSGDTGRHRRRVSRTRRRCVIHLHECTLMACSGCASPDRLRIRWRPELTPFDLINPCLFMTTSAGGREGIPGLKPPSRLPWVMVLVAVALVAGFTLKKRWARSGHGEGGRDTVPVPAEQGQPPGGVSNSAPQQALRDEPRAALSPSATQVVSSVRALIGSAQFGEARARCFRVSGGFAIAGGPSGGRGRPG